MMRSGLRETLAFLCLRSIADNFEKLFNEFQASGSSVLKRNFEYLQRAYPGDISLLLYYRKKNCDEYISFLLNRYLKHVNLAYFIHYDMNAIQKRFLEISDTVEKLEVSYCLSDSFMSTIVSYLENVEYLDFSHSEITNDTLKVIGRECPKLKKLDLNTCTYVTDQGLKNFCYPYGNCKKTRCQLQSLNLFGSLVTDHGVQYILQEIESLEELYCVNLLDVFHNIYKTNKTRKYNLTKVHIWDKLPSTRIVCSVLCPKVKSLVISKIVSIETLNCCTNFSYLENVTLISSSEKWSVDKFLELQGQQLICLHLTSLSVSISTLTQYCPKLVNLCLRDMHFKHTDEKISCSFQFLKIFTAEYFDLSGGDRDKSIATILSLSPNLCSLNMRHCPSFISTNIAQEIYKLSELKSVDFSCSSIDVAVIQALITTGSCIENVTIEHCVGINFSDYKRLMTELRSIDRKVSVYWGAA